MAKVADNHFNQNKNLTHYSNFLLLKAALYYKNERINEDEALEIIKQIENLTGNEVSTGKITLMIDKLNYLLYKKDLNAASHILEILNNFFSCNSHDPHFIIIRIVYLRVIRY